MKKKTLSRASIIENYKTSYYTFEGFKFNPIIGLYRVEYPGISYSPEIKVIYKNMLQVDQSSKKPTHILVSSINSHCFKRSPGLNWNYIYSFKVSIPDDYECPICYHYLCAPRILKCGHCLCADCLNLLVSHTEDISCPICRNPFSIDEPKRVEVVFSGLKPGNIVKFKKVSRFKSDNIVFPYGKSPKTLYRASDSDGRFSDIVICDRDYQTNIINYELDVLFAQTLEYTGDYEDKEKLEELENVKMNNVNELVYDNGPEFLLPITRDANDTISTFYQYDDGRNIYLDNLTVTLLTEQFGSLENGPDTLECNLISFREKFIKDYSKIHTKYLTHVSTDAPVKFAFLDLSGIVDDDILKQYEGKIESKKPKPNVTPPPQDERVVTEQDYFVFDEFNDVGKSRRKKFSYADTENTESTSDSGNRDDHEDDFLAIEEAYGSRH